MTTMPIRWKVNEVLDQNGITTYKFWKESGLNKRTAYRLADPEADNTVSINGDTIDATMKALKSLTGKSFLIQDLLEYQE